MAASEVSQVVMDANTVTTITNNINSLYSNAISQLTSYTLGVVAIVGILIPVLVTLIQWRSLKVEKDNLEKHISDEIAKVKSNIRVELETEIKQQVLAVESNLLVRIEDRFKVLEKQLECADASSFHIQGNANIAKKSYGFAARDFCHATKGYLSGGDELNGPRTLRLLIESCLPNIDKDNYEKNELGEKIDELIAFLKEINENKRYSDSIAQLNRERNAAIIRNPKAAV